jgi:hypothetical protein
MKNMGLHLQMEGSKAAPPLPWWQKLEQYENLKNPVSGGMEERRKWIGRNRVLVPEVAGGKKEEDSCDQHWLPPEIAGESSFSCVCSHVDWNWFLSVSTKCLRPDGMVEQIGRDMGLGSVLTSSPRSRSVNYVTVASR